MPRKSVGLVDLGEDSSLKISKLANELNGRQREFEFIEAESITLEAMGEPDVDDIWYSVNNLFQVLNTHVAVGSYDYVVGVARSPLACKDESGGVIDRNYFSCSDEQKLSVVTSHTNVFAFKPRWKTRYQYLAYLIIAELIINVAKQNLMHSKADNCLFDDCVERTRLAECIDESHVCDSCRAQLRKANVSNATLQAVESILSWCRKDTWSMTFRYSISHPLTTFGFGVGLGWLASALVTAEQYGIMILAMIIIPVGLSFYRRFIHRGS